jgi:hypothetical protein
MSFGAIEELDWDHENASCLWSPACSLNHSGLAKPTRPVLCQSWASVCDRQLLDILAAADVVFVYFMEEQLAGLTTEEIAIAKLATERSIWRPLFKEGCVAELGKGALVVKVVEDKEQALEVARSGQAMLPSQDLSSKEPWEEIESLDSEVDHGLYWEDAGEVSFAIQSWIGT